jgi:hypothetical protein
MKIWRSYGSGHSARLSIIGEFKDAGDAELMRLVLEDYVNAELEKRYPNIEAFTHAWRSRFGDIIASGLGPSQNEFFLGIESAPHIVRSGSTVEVSEMQTAEIGGIIKLMLLKYPTEIKVTGETGP